MSKQVDLDTQGVTQGGTYIDRLIATMPYKQIITRRDGSCPQLVFSERPIAEAGADMFRAANKNCKPVSTVLNRRTRQAIKE